MPPIASISLMPATAMVPRGGQFPFQAICTDVNGMQVPPPPDLVWSVDGAAFGSVGPQGMFWDNAPYTVQVRASVGAVSGTATVTII
jgi:hypothetical protein